MSKINREFRTTRLSITMFGRFRIEMDGEILKPHRPPDFRMLAYLLLRHDCPVDRNAAAVCWKKSPDAALWESEARTYLARAVSALTSKLGSEGKRLQKPHPQLLLFETTGLDLDLLTWEAGIAEGSVEALESIASLYRRPLLEGWNDPWIQQARERFRNDYVRALRSAARRETDHGQWRAALQAFTLLFEIDPLNAETLLDHLQLLAGQRRFQEMQRLYDAYIRQCEALLAPIDTQTAQCYRELRAAADLRGYNMPSGWLPTRVSRFIPRPNEIQEICDWVRTERLTTLTGAGGVGKTRLAIAAAEEMREEFYDRAWFLDLSELQNPAEVPTQVARALSLVEDAGRPTTAEIVTFLRDKEALLILDNCEHVLEASARLAAFLLENCPEVKILTTSREPLGITGEAIWRVPSLDFPQTEARLTPQQLAQFGAVRLLVERASRPQFPLTIDAHNADAIARICRRLDGIPLAIELAAVQITRRSQSVQDVADSLDQALAFLTEGSTVAPSRQQTLRAAIEWSYRLLSSVEQQVFGRTGVFVGGFTEEAARQVCGAPPLTPEVVAGAVTSLAEKSLMELRHTEKGVRYHLLQTIRQFALERLAERQDADSETATSDAERSKERADTHRRHLRHFTAFTEEAEKHHRGADHADWLDCQSLEHENCRSALAWALQNGEYETGLRLAGNLAGYLYTRGHHTEAAECLAAFLGRTSFCAPGRLKAVHWAGNIAYAHGDFAAARTYFEAGLALREREGDPRGIAVGRASLAAAIGGLGSHDEALALFEANLTVFEALKDLRNAALCWISMGMIADEQEDHDRAKDCVTRSLQLFREAADSANVSLAASNLASVHIRLGDYTAARPLLAECLELYRTLRTHHRLVYILLHYLSLAVREEEFERAAKFFGFEKAFRESIGFVPPPKISEKYRVEEETIRRHLGASLFETHAARGVQMSEEEMITSLLRASPTCDS